MADPLSELKNSQFRTILDTNRTRKASHARKQPAWDPNRFQPRYEDPTPAMIRYMGPIPDGTCEPYRLYDLLIASLPGQAVDASSGFWTDGCILYANSQEKAAALAGLLEALGLTGSARTGYFDPEEDALEGGPFETTGWWYIDI